MSSFLIDNEMLYKIEIPITQLLSVNKHVYMENFTEKGIQTLFFYIKFVRTVWEVHANRRRFISYFTESVIINWVASQV